MGFHLHYSPLWRSLMRRVPSQMSRPRGFAPLIAVSLFSACTLNVQTAGTGAGTVTSNPSGINCSGSGTDCTETTLRPASYTLTATAGIGSTFMGWGGACSGTAPCSIDVNGTKTAIAFFQASLAAGAYHTCAVRLGAVFCWGRNSDGQVGAADPTFPSPFATPISLIGVRISALTVAAGGYHSCGIFSDRSVR